MSTFKVERQEIVDDSGMIDWSQIRDHPLIPTSAQDSLIEVANLRSDLDRYKDSTRGQIDDVIPASRIDSRSHDPYTTPVSPQYALAFIKSNMRTMPASTSDTIGGIKTTQTNNDLDISTRI